LIIFPKIQSSIQALLKRIKSTLVKYIKCKIEEKQLQFDSFFISFYKKFLDSGRRQQFSRSTWQAFANQFDRP